MCLVEEKINAHAHNSSLASVFLKKKNRTPSCQTLAAIALQDKYLKISLLTLKQKLSLDK